MGKYSTLNKKAVHQDATVQKKKSTQNVPGFEDNRPEAAQLAKFNEAEAASGSQTVQRVTLREQEKRGGKVWGGRLRGKKATDDRKGVKKPKKMDFESRLRRLSNRRAKIDLPALATGVPKPTPFGMTTLSRQRFSPLEPQTTARIKDFKAKKNPGAKYIHWTKKIGKAKNWRKMAQSMDTNSAAPSASFTPQQKMSAALIHSTTQNSEPYRFGGADKLGRSAIRAKGQDENEGESFEHLFPMAGDKGSHAYQEMLDGTLKPSKKQKKVIEDMSDSSDDED